MSKFLLLLLVLILAFLMGRYVQSADGVWVLERLVRRYFSTPISSKQLLYKEYSKHCGDAYYAGDLGVMNLDGSRKYLLTRGECFTSIGDSSADGRYVIVGSNKKADVAVVDLITGEVMPVIDFVDDVFWRKAFWYSDKEIGVGVIALGDTRKFIVVSILDQSSRVVAELPVEAAGFVEFSEDRKWVASVILDLPANKWNVYSFNLQTDEKYQLTEGGYVYFGAWRDEYVIYTTYSPKENGLWQIRRDGQEREKLVDLGEWRPAIAGLTFDGSKVFYSAERGNTRDMVERAFGVYDFLTSKSSQIEIDQGLSLLNVSGDGKLGIYRNETSRAMGVIELETGKMTELCKSGDGCELSFPKMKS